MEILLTKKMGKSKIENKFVPTYYEVIGYPTTKVCLLIEDILKLKHLNIPIGGYIKLSISVTKVGHVCGCCGCSDCGDKVD
jgi:hypothetical protein